MTNTKKSSILGTSKIPRSSKHPYGLEAEVAATRASMQSTIKKAKALKEFLDTDWKYKEAVPQGFQNHVIGWNNTPEILEEARHNDQLLSLDVDLTGEDSAGNTKVGSCSNACPHCYSQEGTIDSARGKKGSEESQGRILPFNRLIDQISEARSLGLRNIRILGPGEPTETKALVPFVEKVSELGLTTTMFSRGRAFGSDERTRRVYGCLGIGTASELTGFLRDHNVSIIFGYSSLDDTVHDSMVGRRGHSGFARQGLKNLIDAGFLDSNPTRLAIEAPICELNMREFPVSYIMFQSLGISPLYNAYMVAGRYDADLFDRFTPSIEDRVDIQAQITYSMRQMGIDSDIGPYAGTKECHDMDHGMFIPSTGEILPCPGYESREEIIGDLNHQSITEIWESRPRRVHSSVCPPKPHAFPPDYADQVEAAIEKNKDRYAQTHEMIMDNLGLASQTQNNIVQLPTRRNRFYAAGAGIAAAAAAALLMFAPVPEETDATTENMIADASFTVAPETCTEYMNRLQDRLGYVDRAFRMGGPCAPPDQE